MDVRFIRFYSILFDRVLAVVYLITMTFMLRDYSFTSERDLIPYDQQIVDNLRKVLKNQLHLSLLHASPPFNL